MMTSSWLPSEDETPTPRDVEFMAQTLEGRHGQHAAEVAEFFSSLHTDRGDAGRGFHGLSDRVVAFRLQGLEGVRDP